MFLFSSAQFLVGCQTTFQSSRIQIFEGKTRKRDHEQRKMLTKVKQNENGSIFESRHKVNQQIEERHSWTEATFGANVAKWHGFDANTAINQECRVQKCLISHTEAICSAVCLRKWSMVLIKIMWLCLLLRMYVCRLWKFLHQFLLM